MNNFLLSKTGRLLFPFLLIMSLIVLYRGHNLPGGGFIGGLMAALPKAEALDAEPSSSQLRHKFAVCTYDTLHASMRQA